MALVLVTGPPGTGKSTIADIAASELGAAVLGWDWVMASLTAFEDLQRTFAAMDRERHRSVGWSILTNLAIAQLRQARSVVLDGVARTAEVNAIRRVAAECGTSAFVVSTLCSDLTLHRSRVEHRRRDIPGWHELDWSHVKSVLAAWAEPDEIDLRLDAADEISANTESLTSALASLN